MKMLVEIDTDTQAVVPRKLSDDMEFEYENSMGFSAQIVWDHMLAEAQQTEQAQQPKPIPTSERLPTEADADYSGAVFAFTAFTKEWVLQHWAHVADCPNAYLYWQKTGLTLPAAPDSGDVL